MNSICFRARDSSLIAVQRIGNRLALDVADELLHDCLRSAFHFPKDQRKILADDRKTEKVNSRHERNEDHDRCHTAAGPDGPIRRHIPPAPITRWRGSLLSAEGVIGVEPGLKSGHGRTEAQVRTKRPIER